MPRNQRCVLSGQAYHVTQRGTNRQRVFFTAADRTACLRLVRGNLADAGVRVLAWRLMTNHVHFVAVPERTDSLAVLLRAGPRALRADGERTPAMRSARRRMSPS